MEASSAEKGSNMDDLSKLKAGSIYVDEKGKRYRVGKAMLPSSLSGGPVGKGDPEDRTLRKIEAEVLIPKLMNDEIEKYECRESYLGMMKCLNEGNRFTQFSRCRAANDIFGKCKTERFGDPEFRQMITNRYLDDRSEYRQTGLSLQEREFERYRAWKKTQEKSVPNHAENS